MNLRRTSGGLSRRTLVALVLVVILSVFSSVAGVSAASWTLIDNHQSPCYSFPSGRTWSTNYYGVWISGTWTHDITVDVTGLPKGSTSWTYDSPIPAGSSDGKGSLAYIAVQLSSSTPQGTYTATLRATDGVTSASVPVGLRVQARCSRY
jgi:hypothetical protein